MLVSVSKYSKFPQIEATSPATRSKRRADIQCLTISKLHQHEEHGKSNSHYGGEQPAFLTG